MRYKIGDWITVRPDLSRSEWYYMEDDTLGIGVVPEMLEFAGREAEIVGLSPQGRYFIANSDNVWVDGMFSESVIIKEISESDISLNDFLNI